MFLILFIPFLLFANVYQIHNKELKTLFEFSDAVFSKEDRVVLKFSDFSLKKCNSKVDLNISNKIDLAKYQYFRNDLGIYLDFSGNYNDKTTQKSLNLGLSWKLLNGGYKENQNKAEIIKLQNKLKQLDKQQINKSFLYYNDYNFIIYYFNQQKIELLNSYLKFLKLKFDIFKYRYFLHTENFEKLFLIKQQIKDIQNLQNEYLIFNQKVTCKKDLYGIVNDFDLNYQNILDDIQDKNSKLKVKLNQKIIDLKYDKLNNWSFNLYANKEIYNSKKSTIGEDFGFNLNIPLFEDFSQIKKLEKLKTISDQEEKQIRLFLYLQKNYYTFRYKLSDLIKLKYKLAYTLTQLKRAKLRYKFGIGNDNLDRIISNIDSIFNIKYQILEVKQQLLLKAYSLLYNLNLDYKDKYFKPIKIDTNLHLRKGNRSIYMWANGFKKYSNDILIQLLKIKNIKIAIISISKYQNMRKLKKFLELAKQNNIRVEFLISINSWLFHYDYIDKFLKNLDKYKNYNIHIFLEPNVVTIYKTRFVGILKYIKTHFPKYQISVTIPLLDDKKMLELSKYSDYIYISENFNKRKYRLLHTQIFKVFNCKKYKNELELEIAIDNFINADFINVALYNLKTYIKEMK